MDNLDDLKVRIEKAISELQNIFQLLEKDINNPEIAVSLNQVKEIEASIDRFKRKGLSVPAELKQLKIKLFSSHELHNELTYLYKRLKDDIRRLISSGVRPRSVKTLGDKPKPDRSPYRKPPNYEKPLGSKGNSNLDDYLIPVIKLMWGGHDHREAFKQIAQKLDVRYNTVSAQCTRALGLTTDEFISRVKSKTIVDIIVRKYPDNYQVIKTQLK